MKDEGNEKLLEEIDKRFDEKTEEIKRHMNVLIEEVDGKLDLITEGQGAIREKVDSLETKVDLLVEDMDYVKSTLADNKERFKETADKAVVDDHEKRIVKLEGRVLAEA